MCVFEKEISMCESVSEKKNKEKGECVFMWVRWKKKKRKEKKKKKKEGKDKEKGEIKKKEIVV